MDNIKKEKSQIIDINNIRNILQYVNTDTLVIFDIDNTLIETKQEFGGHAWSLSLTKRLQEKGLSYVDAIKKSYKMFAQVQDFVVSRPVESDTVSVLQTLQEKKIQTMLLTLRSFNLAQITSEHLLSVNMNFAQHAIHDQEIIISETAGYTNGILYTGPQVQKGNLLLTFFEQIKYVPYHVLFVDDVRYHVESVAQCLEEANISITCIRYGATDERSQGFDPAVADEQLLALMGKEKYKEVFSEIL